MSEHPLEKEYPIYQEIIEVIGVDNFLKLSEKIGGRYFRWPKLRSFYFRPKRTLMVQLRAEGKTFQEIGETLGTTRENIFAVLKKEKTRKYA